MTQIRVEAIQSGEAKDPTVENSSSREERACINIDVATMSERRTRELRLGVADCDARLVMTSSNKS